MLGNGAGVPHSTLAKRREPAAGQSARERSQLATVGSMKGFGAKGQGENSKSPPPRRNGWATIRSQSSRNRPVRTRTPGGVGALTGAIPSGRPD